MKQFVKASDKDGACFADLNYAFPGLSCEKLKAGIFDGPQFRKLSEDRTFSLNMTKIEQDAGNSYVLVVKDFLESRRAQNYMSLVETMLTIFQALGARMSIKLHFLFCHLDHFPENLGDMSEEQGERFHQGIKVMEEGYQGRWDTHIMADYYWCLMRDCSEKNYKRKLYNLFFIYLFICHLLYRETVKHISTVTVYCNL